MQLVGTAMGTRMAPSYANLFMADLETSFLATQSIKPLLWKRFIDDIMCIWPGTIPQLETFLNDLNSFHPTIKFTWEYSEKNITFLDLNIYKGKRFQKHHLLDMSTFFKKTNTFQYLHYSTSHPKHTLIGIIKGEAIRFLRSNSDPENFKETISNFRKHLLRRKYPGRFVDKALSTITFSDRNKYIPSNPPMCSPNTPHSSNPTSTTTPTTLPTTRPLHNTTNNIRTHTARLITTYSPYYKSLYTLLTHAWHHIQKDPTLSLLFPSTPQICYKKNPSHSNQLVRARTSKEDLETHGSISPLRVHSHQSSTTCQQSKCPACIRMPRIKTIKSQQNQTVFPLPQNLSCNDSKIIYCIKCNTCGKMYIGRTTTTLKEKISHHIKSSFNHNKCKQQLYRHYSRKTHNFRRDAKFIPLEKCSHLTLVEREKTWILRLNTIQPLGLNTTIP